MEEEEKPDNLAWQWNEPDDDEEEIDDDDDELSLNVLLETFLLPRLKQWRVSTPDDLKHPLLIGLSNWMVNHVVPKEIACTRIKMSSIPNAGYGLWATRNIATNEYITVYGGAYYENAEVFRDINGVGPNNRRFKYVLNLKPVLSPDGKQTTPYLDGELHFLLWEQGRWANTQMTEDACNALFEEKTDTKGGYWQLRLKATKPIASGTEIFVWYDENYIKFHFPQHSTKRVKLEMCIQCQIKESTKQFQGKSHLHFCGQECATHFWRKNGKK